MKKVLSIQYMRAAAALAVALFHAMDRLGFGHVGALGAAGVDVFFVISGFVMWSIASASGRTSAAFLKNRITRIVPVYWFYTLLIVFAAVAYPAIFPRLQVNMEHVASSLFFIPHYSPDDGAIHPLVAVGWTLNYEMFFYAVFATFLFLPASQRFTGLLATLALIVAAGLFYTGKNPILLTYSDPLLLEFGAGVALARLVELGRIPGRKAGLLIAGAGIAGFAASALFDFLPQYRVLLWGVPAFALVSGFVIFERRGGIGSFKGLEVLGDASYSIYLVHPTVIAVVAVVMGQQISHAFPTVFVAIALVAAALAGLCSYFFVERPLNRVLRRAGADGMPAAASVKLEPALQRI